MPTIEIDTSTQPQKPMSKRDLILTPLEPIIDENWKNEIGKSRKIKFFRIKFS